MELGEWRKALAEVGSLRGWEAEKFAYGKKEALVELVVARVVSLLKTTFKLPTELVGIDDHVKYIMSSIDPKYNDTRIIEIRGVCGSGKTTLAKVLWNNLSGDFEHLSFVRNIREVSLRMGIESPHTLSNVDEGINIIKSQFTSKKVLIILDDMDDDIHLNALVGDGSWLKVGSIIIITTRNVSILDKANADPKHELNELTRYQALTLFSRHLFGKDSPPEADEYISMDAVSNVKRIPLILELIGSSFRQKRKEVWKDTFKKLKDDVCNKNMQELLDITYETLDYEQQQIFLDIACFFIESSKQYPTYMWDTCGFYQRRGLKY
ncbi:hypothetical protein EUGRSUZ_L01098 [Eucalyptus grandis]|uniref:NB-ARC domain-containing protein n=1 Tax=Eucalyptus grandis TaxID=71139 RepID=A0A058ZW17_EUCGR|nr:hypothetical protein EUGRSUZ_L01098 [Eucalyptus grandis]